MSRLNEISRWPREFFPRRASRRAEDQFPIGFGFRFELVERLDQYGRDFLPDVPSRETIEKKGPRKS